MPVIIPYLNVYYIFLLLHLGFQIFCILQRGKFSAQCRDLLKLNWNSSSEEKWYWLVQVPGPIYQSSINSNRYCRKGAQRNYTISLRNRGTAFLGIRCTSPPTSRPEKKLHIWHRVSLVNTSTLVFQQENVVFFYTESISR